MPHFTYILWSFLLLLNSTTSLFAQRPGSLDSSFGTGGIVSTLLPNDSFTLNYTSSALQTDGKYIVIGSYLRNNGGRHSLLSARYLPNGSLDASWGQNGLLLSSPNDLSGYSIQVFRVLIQPDEKVLIIGRRDTLIIDTVALTSTGFAPILLRYLPDGRIDSSFGQHGVVAPFYGGGNMFQEGLIQNDRILAIGYRFFDSIQICAFRLDNGEVDSSFGQNGRQVYSRHGGGTTTKSLAEQGQNILLFETANSVRNARVTRFLPNGEVDSSFANNGQLDLLYAHGLSHNSGQNYPPQSIITLADNKILLASSGEGHLAPNDRHKGVIERYHPNGELDTSFADSGTLVVDFGFYTPPPSGAMLGLGATDIRAIAVQSNGNILVSGNAINPGRETQASVLMCYDSAGQLDTSFANQGRAVIDIHPNDRAEYALGLHIQPDDKIVQVGKTISIGRPLVGPGARDPAPSTFNLVRYHGDSLATTSTEQVAPASHILLQAYPNPAKEHLHTSFTIEQPGRIELALYDTQGRKVQSLLQDQRKAGEHQESFQLDRGLAAGLYVLKLQTEQSYFAQIVVIQ